MNHFQTFVSSSFYMVHMTTWFRPSADHTSVDFGRGYWLAENGSVEAVDGGRDLPQNDLAPLEKGHQSAKGSERSSARHCKFAKVNHRWSGKAV